MEYLLTTFYFLASFELRLRSIFINGIGGLGNRLAPVTLFELLYKTYTEEKNTATRWLALTTK
jgi:hypothetical protein